MPWSGLGYAKSQVKQTITQAPQPTACRASGRVLNTSMVVVGASLAIVWARRRALRRASGGSPGVGTLTHELQRQHLRDRGQCLY
jgi:hypothetical protein